MDTAASKERFYRLVHPSLPNDWEVDEIIEGLAVLEDQHRDLLFSQIPVIWPISHSLCFSFLEQGAEVIDKIPVDLVPQWVRTILRSYETDGLGAARRFIVDAEERFLEPLRSRNMVRYEEVAARILFYLRGISGRTLDLEVQPIAATDTGTIFVPPSLAVLPRYEQNQLLYKFLVTLHWGFVRAGIFRIPPAGDGADEPSDAPGRSVPAPRPADHLATFAEVELAADIFFLLATGRVMAWIAAELPGLARQFAALQADLRAALTRESAGAMAAAVTDLAEEMLFGAPHERYDGAVSAGAVEGDLAAVARHYHRIAGLGGSYLRPPLLNLLGRHDFNRAAAGVERRRARTKEAFILQLQALSDSLAAADESAGVAEAGDGGQTVLTVGDAEKDAADRLMRVIDNPDATLPDELTALIEAVKDDLGHIPVSYVSAAAGTAGRGVGRDAAAATEEHAAAAPAVHYFDEWDYRRHGFRKNWCHLYEKELPVRRSTFVAATLARHRGLLMKLRRQFEFMKTSEQFVRRQREGLDLDLDAIVEARCDQRAGISPSDKLFVRLLRNDRDLATVFLVDLSSSTEGWVGTVIKEALVLLCEVMEVAGDPYGIIGFSGMRRLRCEVFSIKGVDEPYDHRIHERINSLGPREYTRMGPAIRYATRCLQACEARTRMLVTITDGKPEDYDDYKGDYAIEDTRKALMECRGGGMHAFCITVDRQAHEYLPHMFGQGNYIFIDDIAKLPLRLVDMYRLLTA